MNVKTIVVSVLIFVFRMIDLATTKLALKNFEMQEQNIIVKMTSMSMVTFFILDTVLALFLALLYLYYSKNRFLFSINTSSLKQYTNMFFFDKSKSKIKDWFVNLNLRKTVVLFGAIVPAFVITTSTLFSLNNYWVYLFDEGDELAIKYYLLFNRFYLFDFIIFVFPVLFILVLLVRKVCLEYRLSLKST